MFEEKLCQIGLTVNEARVYLEMVKMGPQPASVICKRSDLNRTTTYSVLAELSKKGMISFHSNVGGMKLFVANDPNAIIGYLDRQSRTYDYFKSEILALIPKIRSMTGDCEYKGPVTKFFEGIEGVKYVMRDALNAKSELLAYLALDKWFELDMKEFLLEYKDCRISERKVPLRAIVKDELKVRAFFEQNYDPKNPMTRLVYAKTDNCSRLFENEVNIYDDKVAIISLEKGAEFALLIQSKEVAMTQRAIFEMAWKSFENVGRSGHGNSRNIRR